MGTQLPDRVRPLPHYLKTTPAFISEAGAVQLIQQIIYWLFVGPLSGITRDMRPRNYLKLLAFKYLGARVQHSTPPGAVPCWTSR